MNSGSDQLVVLLLLVVLQHQRIRRENRKMKKKKVYVLVVFFTGFPFYRSSSVSVLDGKDGNDANRCRFPRPLDCTTMRTI